MGQPFGNDYEDLLARIGSLSGIVQDIQAENAKLRNIIRRYCTGLDMVKNSIKRTVKKQKIYYIFDD